MPETKEGRWEGSKRIKMEEGEESGYFPIGNE